MPLPQVEAAQGWLRQHETELLRDYRAILQIPSIEAEPLPNAPFGQGNRDALDFALQQGEAWGMRTKDLDGFCGYAEFGSGDKLLLVLGHLDVVPVSPDWKHAPFGAEIDGGYVYARGAVDDKGPTMAAFYAARAIQQTFPDLPCRLRVFFGCNEESGFECVHHYAKNDEAPTLGIAPDSGWPLYHGEKGIANFIVEKPLIGGDFALLEACGGQRPNIVIDSLRARVRVSPAVRAEVDSKLADAWDRNLEFAWAGDVLEINSKGKAAHGAWPFGGDSAAIRCFRFLMEIAPVSATKAYTELFERTHISGGGLGIHGADDPSGDLTCNLGIVETIDGSLKLTFNVRYPVTWKGPELRAKCEAHLESLDGGYRLAEFSDSAPLYFPIEHPLVKTIRDVYREETGDDSQPGVMGGGTYARALPNTVSIGTGWEGDGAAHENDERLKIDHLYKMSRIYAHILLRLALL
ncbi:MAG: putative dipeptidase [Fimbriimonadaceae bacterium]|nr:putative dipeptidase [Fimbriimonadaceae bacterium]